METIHNIFPNFVPNQVLSSAQLNALRDYLDQQDRISRVQLCGTGIICGLNLATDADEGVVTVSNGFGISSDGYLINLPEGVFSHWRTYTDPSNDEDGLPAYELWRQRPALTSQIELLQLLEGQENPDTDKPLAAAQLDGRVALLYLQISDQNLRSCLVTDCNNKGSNLRFTPVVLLVKAADLQALPACAPPPELISVPRLHTELMLPRITTTVELNSGYSQLVGDLLPGLITGIRTAFTRYGAALGFDAGELLPVSAFNAALKGAVNSGEIDQYHYDLVVEVATAHNEFIESACRWVPDCASATGYPQHLMLGHLGRSEGFRHHFDAAAVHVHTHADFEKTANLLRRLLAMVASVKFDKELALTITPSHGEHRPLGDRAIPFYYGFSDQQASSWRPDDCCTPGLVWRHRGGGGGLEQDYRRSSLMRIEGHLEQNWAEASARLATLRRQHNVEFDLLVLFLEGAGEREREARTRLDEMRAVNEGAQVQLALFVGKAAEVQNFRPTEFKRGYSSRVEKIRESKRALIEGEKQWQRVRIERKSLCNLAHLDADYGVLRAAIICSFQRLLASIGGEGRIRIPPLPERSPDERKRRLEEVADAHKRLGEKIREESDRSKLEQLEKERALVEVDKVAIETEESLVVSVRGLVPMAMAKLAAVQLEETEKAAAGAVGLIGLVRGDSVENAVKMAERVSQDGIRVQISELIDLLPEALTVFDLGAFMTAYKRLVTDLIGQRLMTTLKQQVALTHGRLSRSGAIEQAMLRAISAELQIEEQDRQHMLLSLLHDCRHAGLSYLAHLFDYYRQHNGQKFADFASLNPGVEHLAGVEKGGTFILVAQSDQPGAPVVADFALKGKVSCCCKPPESLCLPPVAMPDYRVARLHPAVRGEGYQPVELTIDVLANDFDPNQRKQADYLRYATLVAEQSALGAKLAIDKVTGSINYRLEGPVAGAVDRFSYDLVVKGSDCDGSDRAEVLVLLIAGVQPEPELGAIKGLVTWQNEPAPQALVTIEGSDRTAVTDKQGVFGFDNLDPGTFVLTALLWDGEVTSDPQVVEVKPGETATTEFRLPKEQQAKIGNLRVSVTNGSTKEPVNSATVTLQSARGQIIASTDESVKEGTYQLNGVPVGKYLSLTTAEGFFSSSDEGVEIEAGSTVQLHAVLMPRTVNTPGRGVEFIAVNDGVSDSAAKDKLARVYSERQSDYLSAVEKAGSEPSVGNSIAYENGKEFIVAIQNPELSEAEVIKAYDKVSKSLATSVNGADEARKADYRVILGSASKAFMDRISLESPEKLSTDADKAMIEMNRVVTGAGIDSKALGEAWKAEELSEGLGFKSTGRIIESVRK
ncbi:MAG: hypothetical protein DRQ54_07175 [Gammaproteobacteria bacterium]|nr:MAG: hypothetical protein DRQ54_07175 [Gammaproteobacteria bacterium]